MNAKLVVAAASVAVIAVAYYAIVLGSENGLAELFPDVDKKIIKKIHREMVRESLAGEYANLNEDDLASIFRMKLSIKTEL